MDNKCSVRIMRSEIHNIKNVNFGEVTYMNYGCINSKASFNYKDVLGVYGQNGSGKTALVESIDILRCILMGGSVPYAIYGGIISKNDMACLVTDFFIQADEAKYKVTYTVFLRVNDEKKAIEVRKENLVYWLRGSSWKGERDLEFENTDYDNEDLLNKTNKKIKSAHERQLKDIPFLWSMENLSFVCAQQNISVLFNRLVMRTLKELTSAGNKEAIDLNNVIRGLMQFGSVDLNVIKVNQLGTINTNQNIPINIRQENDSSISKEIIYLHIADPTEIEESYYVHVYAAIEAINIALRSIIPNLQIEIETKAELDRPDGSKARRVEVYSNRDGKRFLLKYESEGIKRIISILNNLISVFNDPGVCLVVDELDSGIFEYLLGELLGLMHKDMKGQLIFTSHNLRILEKLDAQNIICSTTNPDNRYIRLVGIEKNNNKRDFYIRAITVGGQKESLYDEEDLIAMGYAFRKAGKTEENNVKINFSPEFEKSLHGTE